ncbi:MAG: MGMT family protein [Desulfobacterales bacterium]
MIEIIKSIPAGKVCAYGRIALIAVQPNGAKLVTRVIQSVSRKHNLPWYRIINTKGFISLPKSLRYNQQKALLQREGVQFDEKDWIDLKSYLRSGEE